VNKKEAREKAFNYIDKHRSEILDWLCGYVEIPSVTLHELQVQEWTRDQLLQWGMFDKVDYWPVDAEAKRPDVVALISGRGGAGEKLIYNGHCDTAPVEKDQRPLWSVEPFKGTMKDGRIYGRGANDVKGGNTAMTWAARAIKECEIELANDLILEFVVGEEHGTGIGTDAATERGYRAPFCIALEPTNCEIASVMLGNFTMRMYVKGKGVHTSAKNLMLYPQRYGLPCGNEVAVDAIEKMDRFLHAFRDLERQWGLRYRHPLLGAARSTQGLAPFTICVSIIRGGTYYSSIPEFCQIDGEVYYPPWVKYEDIIKEIKDLIAHVSATDDWLRENPPVFEAPVLFHQVTREEPMDVPGCRAFANAWKEATGEEAIFNVFKGGCGEITYLHKAGIPGVVFGPGDLLQGAHGPDEFVPVEQVMQATKAFAAMAIDWCGVA
jgi:acetylornithine deacetylase